jgi:MFS family permease
VPGTDHTALIRRLTIAGWLFLGGSIGLISFQLERVRSIRGSGAAFADAWDQRLEVLSFLMLPPNLVVLAPAALIAATASWLAGPERDTWLVTLLRLITGIAIAMFVIGVVSIISILLRNDTGPSEIDGVFLRIGGMSLAAGIVALCGPASKNQPAT